jgi:Predicted metal-dependent RNase, consists of a metallo-beta-lactamase domain and an RNA-binding KH domain
MNLNKAQYPKVIISASGMANAGRIRHHLKHNLWNPQNSLVFVGYQAEGTLGRLILDGVKKVKLLGEEIIVGLEVYNLQGFSAHADILHIREWLSHFEKKPKKAFVVHGEVDAANSLSRELLYDFGIESIIPNFGDGFIIKDGFTSQISDLDINILNERFDILNEIELLEDEIKNLKLLIEENKNDKILRKSYDILKNKVTEAKNVLLEINLLLGK